MASYSTYRKAARQQAGSKMRQQLPTGPRPRCEECPGTPRPSDHQGSAKDPLGGFWRATRAACGPGNARLAVSLCAQYARHGCMEEQLLDNGVHPPRGLSCERTSGGHCCVCSLRCQICICWRSSRGQMHPISGVPACTAEGQTRHC